MPSLYEDLGVERGADSQEIRRAYLKLSSPGGTLVGLLKRAEPSIQTFALKTPEDISGARSFAKEHGGK